MSSIPSFCSSVTHRRLDASQWNETYVIGDVHGCADTLDRLLAEVGPGPSTLLVFVGDLVQKGPDSAGVVERVRGMDNAVSVRGNNEAELIGGEKSLPELSDEDFAYLESLPTAVSWEGSVVVHGGVDHRKPLSEHGVEDLLTMRSLSPDGGYARPYWFETRCERPRVFFGHTVLAEAFESGSAVGLDTGCVHGGALTAYDCRRERFLSVEPPETYVERSADSIVEPSEKPQCIQKR